VLVTLTVKTNKLARNKDMRNINYE